MGRSILKGKGIVLVDAAFTCKLSTVNGVAFITNPSQDISKYLNRKATLTAGGKTLVGWIKAAGSGESLGTALNVSNCANLSYDTFDGASSTGFHAISTGTSPSRVAGTADEIVFTLGALYKSSFDLTLTSGTAPTVLEKANLGGSQLGGFVNSVNGANTKYSTITTSATGVLQFQNASIAEFTVANLAVKKVNSPSATGVRIVDAQGSSTYNWTSNDGLDANSASYTLTISAR
jgi:hypothetical protein